MGYAVITMIIFRLLSIPLLIHCLLQEKPMLGVLLFGLAVISDILDGWFGRRFGSKVKVNPYLDPMADFTLVLAIYLTQALKGDFPFWMVLVLLLMFLQFVASSANGKPRYDPLGKYYGFFCFLIGGTAFFWNSLEVHSIWIEGTFLIGSLIFLGFRTIYLCLPNRDNRSSSLPKGTRRYSKNLNI